MKRLGRLLLWLAQYVFLNASALVSLIGSRVFQRTRVYGLENMVYQTNLVLASNHQSYPDSFLVGANLFFPRSLITPRFIPYHLAASENFFKTGLYRLAGRLWRAIPVKAGRRDAELLLRLRRVLPDIVLHVFPEGTRTRTGDIGKASTGFGWLIYHCRPTVVPVRIIGMNNVQPVGHRTLGGEIFAVKRLWQRIDIIVGPPLDLSDLFDQPDTRETTQAVGERVMAAIRSLTPPERERKSARI